MEEILLRFEHYFHQNDFLSDIMINLGWSLVMILKTFVDMVETLLRASYETIHFVNFIVFEKLFPNGMVRLLLMAFLAGAIIFLGYKYIIDCGETRYKVLESVTMIILVLCGLPYFMSELNKITLSAVNGFLPNNTTISSTFIKNGIVDLQYLDKQNFNIELNNGIVAGEGIGIEENKISKIDPTQRVTKDVALNQPDVFFNRLILDEHYNQIVQQIPINKLFGWDMTKYYYRYDIDFVSIFISLLSVALALGCIAFKNTKLAIHLGQYKLLAPFIATSNLTSGQKIKEVMNGIISAYVILVFGAFSVSCFSLIQVFLQSISGNLLIRSMLLFFGAWALIDGPDLIEKLFGIDAGLKSGFQMFTSAYMGTRTALGLGKSVAGGATALGNSAKQGVSHLSSIYQSGDKGGNEDMKGAEKTGGTDKDKQGFTASKSSQRGEIGGKQGETNSSNDMPNGGNTSIEHANFSKGETEGIISNEHETSGMESEKSGESIPENSNEAMDRETGNNIGGENPKGNTLGMEFNRMMKESMGKDRGGKSNLGGMSQGNPVHINGQELPKMDLSPKSLGSMPTGKERGATTLNSNLSGGSNAQMKKDSVSGIKPDKQEMANQLSSIDNKRKDRK